MSKMVQMSKATSQVTSISHIEGVFRVLSEIKGGWDAWRVGMLCLLRTRRR
jgi:hypothetical protein